MSDSQAQRHATPRVIHFAGRSSDHGMATEVGTIGTDTEQRLQLRSARLFSLPTLAKSPWLTATGQHRKLQAKPRRRRGRTKRQTERGRWKGSRRAGWRAEQAGSVARGSRLLGDSSGRTGGEPAAGARPTRSFPSDGQRELALRGATEPGAEVKPSGAGPCSSASLPRCAGSSPPTVPSAGRRTDTPRRRLARSAVAALPSRAR